MSTTPVPRLAGATWYPVPCPEGVPLTLGFPSEEACASFCEAIGPVLDAHQDALVELEEKLAADIESAHDQGYDIGRESGWEDHGQDGCNSTECTCYAVGHLAGYGQAEKDLVADVLARSAESA